MSEKDDQTDDGIVVDEDVVEELTQPQTFFTLWSASRRVVAGRDTRYVVAEVLVGVLVTAAAYLSDAQTSDIAKAVRETSDKIFGFTGAILGILVAAFAILATIGQSPSVVALAVREREREPSEIKKVALHFVAAFVPYLIFAAWYGLVLLVGYYGGPATRVALAYPAAGHVLACIFLGGIAYGLTRMLVVLGALISNVYVTFMLLASGTIHMNAVVRPKPSKPSQTSTPALPAKQGVATGIGDVHGAVKVGPKN